MRSEPKKKNKSDSLLLSYRCHYYDSSENLGCTLGDWHPLSAEKLVAMSLHTGGDMEMLRDGFITVPGYGQCEGRDRKKGAELKSA